MAAADRMSQVCAEGRHAECQGHGPDGPCTCSDPAHGGTPVDELRAAVRLLRDPVQCLPHAPLFADLIGAVADQYEADHQFPVRGFTCDCWATDPMCSTALATARALNGASS